MLDGNTTVLAHTNESTDTALAFDLKHPNLFYVGVDDAVAGMEGYEHDNQNR